MTDSTGKFREPLLHEISTKALRLLISGYIGRNIREQSKDEISLYDDIVTVCEKFYAKAMYITALNNKELKLTLLDTHKNDTIITSNENKDNNEINVDGIKNVGICCKRSINIKSLSKQITNNKINNNDTYNAIFKVGGEVEWSRDDHSQNGSKYCELILYCQDITPSNFDIHYYKLPQLPFDSVDNNPIYSNTYGLISIGNSEICNLKINQEEIEWNVESLPKQMKFEYLFPPNYCFINNNKKEIFIVNGATDNNEFVTQTAIYNLETKQYQILQENKQANALCGIVYNYNTNKVFIGGGNDVTCGVYYYDLHKNEYNTWLRSPNKTYKRPILYLNEQGSILHIACYDTFGKKVRYEWVDLRANQEYNVEWIYQENMYDLSKKVFKGSKGISLINFQ
eukprot:307408_1